MLELGVYERRYALTAHIDCKLDDDYGKNQLYNPRSTHKGFLQRIRVVSAQGVEKARLYLAY